MSSEADDLRLFGGRAGLDAVDAYVARLVAESPPLTQRQKARLRVLLRPAPAEATPKSPRPSQVAA